MLNPLFLPIPNWGRRERQTVVRNLQLANRLIDETNMNEKSSLKREAMKYWWSGRGAYSFNSAMKSVTKVGSHQEKSYTNLKHYHKKQLESAFVRRIELSPCFLRLQIVPSLQLDGFCDMQLLKRRRGRACRNSPILTPLSGILNGAERKQIFSLSPQFNPSPSIRKGVFEKKRIIRKEISKMWAHFFIRDFKTIASPWKVE